MSLEKLPIRIIEIDRPINKVEESIGEIYRHFTIHRFDAAVEFRKDTFSEFQSVQVTFFNVAAPLFLRKNLTEIFPECEDIEERTEDSPENFVDFVVDNISKKKFLKTLRKRYDVTRKRLSKEKRFPVKD